MRFNKFEVMLSKWLLKIIVVPNNEVLTYHIRTYLNVGRDKLRV